VHKKGKMWQEQFYSSNCPSKSEPVVEAKRKRTVGGGKMKEPKGESRKKEYRG